MNALKDKRIILTGATSGIGRSLALKLAAQGAKLCVCGKTPEKMQSLLAELKSYNCDVFAKTFSVTDESEIISFVNESKAKFGSIDILINNAGLNTAKGNVGEIKTSDFDYMIAVNLRAPFIFMREVFNIMKPQQKGTVVNVLSTVCLFSNEGIGSYTASKAGIDALTKIFRKEARKENIKVCSVYPGGTDTPFRNNKRPDYLSPESVADSIISVLLLPEDVVTHEIVVRPMVENNF
jgi:NADP-dependent 3-hydroxy acid dehydrogenase YdfG